MKNKLVAVAATCLVFACSGERPSFGPKASESSAGTSGDSSPSVSNNEGTSGTNTADGSSAQGTDEVSDLSAETESSEEQTSEPDSSGIVAPSPDCEGECCEDQDCPEGFECEGSMCQCKAGQECDDACDPEQEECCTDSDCGESASCTERKCACDEDSHECDGTCSRNDSPQSCGAACEPCPVPVGGAANCDGTKCTASCPSGKQLCAGTCIDDSKACDANCAEGQHECEGVCIAMTSVLACGDSCEPCSAPAHATAKCEDFVCDFDCNSDYVRCEDNTCVSSDGCCGDEDCAPGKVCEDNSCHERVRWRMHTGLVLLRRRRLQ